MRMLLIGAIASIGMLVVPALASASVWQKEGSELSEFAEINMSGLDIFEVSEKNAMICEVNVTMTTEGGESALVTGYETEACPEGTGTLAECHLSGDEPEGLPWEVHVNENDLTITGLHTKRTFTGCTTTTLDKTIGSVTVRLEAPSLISGMEFIGEEGGYSIFDSLTLAEEDSEIYAIG